MYLLVLAKQFIATSWCFCDPMDCVAHSSVEWVAISSFRGSSWSRDGTRVSCRWILYHWATGEAHITLQYSCLGNPMNRVRHDLESKQKQQIYELLNLLFQIHVGSRTPCQNPTFSWDLPQSFGNYLSEAHEVRCVCTHAPPLPRPQRHPLLKEVFPHQYTTSL